eukprot:TRINITY_DN3144_c0_g3_i2.p1 TRINITY_DN3144_c0_g3~~TRINITY_DN3144_c0_g3_i2.p1  ORF type:complete len:372 (-),score=22.25 TRINITY_DN3144_c0_g3_i2:321-1313(-)
MVYCQGDIINLPTLTGLPELGPRIYLPADTSGTVTTTSQSPKIEAIASTQEVAMPEPQPLGQPLPTVLTTSHASTYTPATLPTISPTLDTSPTTSATSPLQQTFVYQGSTRIMIGSCFDITPPDGVSCERQKEFGKCARKWMLAGVFCAKTCEYCDNACIDIMPPSEYTCAQLKERNQCNDQDLVSDNYCKKTCGRCSGDDKVIGAQSPETASSTGPTRSPESFPTSDVAMQPTQDEDICDDIPPNGRYTCQDQKRFKKCDASWMTQGGYCRKTCGRCGEATDAPPKIEMTTNITYLQKCSCDQCRENYKQMIMQVVQQAVDQVLRKISA